MVAERQIIPAEGSLADLLDREPRPIGPGDRSLSSILEELRADER
jgi:hypothetical protein